MTKLNHQVLVVGRPTGIPLAEHFSISATEIPKLADGQFLVRNHFLSVDPAMRGWLSDTNNYKISEQGNLASAIEIGSVMRSVAVGEVIESRSPIYHVGDRLSGWFGWQEYAAARPTDVIQRIRSTDLPLSLWLGILGMNGVTAYLALDEIGKLSKDNTVVVSTASGSVGSAVGQIAKLRGCRTVGIAGGPEKARICTDEFGYDDVIDYKADGWQNRLTEALPNGADVYFDNTAGAISDAVMGQMARHGRVIVCGTASVPSWNPVPLGPRTERFILTKRLKIAGFVIFDHVHRWDEVSDLLAAWVRQGKIRYREEFLSGLESAPDAIAGLYRGENFGKRIIRLTPDASFS